MLCLTVETLHTSSVPVRTEISLSQILFVEIDGRILHGLSRGKNWHEQVLRNEMTIVAEAHCWPTLQEPVPQQPILKADLAMRAIHRKLNAKWLFLAGKATFEQRF
jgi:hypothetical protein